MSTSIERFDDAVDTLFDRMRGHRAVDRAFYTASELGDWSLLWQTLSVARGLRRGGDLGEAFRVSALLGLESLVVNGGIKSLFRRQRPVPDEPRPHRLRQPRTSSFPSGHASAATVFTIIAGEDDPWAPLYAGAAMVVATSRIHVRIHHASDVAGGVVVGAVLAAVFRRWWPLGEPLPPSIRRLIDR